MPTTLSNASPGSRQSLAASPEAQASGLAVPPGPGAWDNSLLSLAAQLSAATPPGSPGRAVEVLAVTAVDDDHRFLHRLFSHSNWIIHTVRGCAEAADFLERQSMPVILCDCELPDGTWQDVLGILERSRQPSLLIVASRTADDFLWAEVLNLGGYDVLMKPFDPAEVVRVVSLAWLHWKNLRDRAARQGLQQPLAASGA